MWQYVLDRLADDGQLEATIAARAADGWRLVSTLCLTNGEGIIILIYEKPVP